MMPSLCQIHPDDLFPHLPHVVVVPASYASRICMLVTEIIEIPNLSRIVNMLVPLVFSPPPPPPLSAAAGAVVVVKSVMSVC